MNSRQFIEKYGPWAVITGASSGLGEEFAVQLSKLGLHLVLVARREDRLRQLADRLEREYGIQTRILQVDLTDLDAHRIVLDGTSDLAVGLLVNNAGFSWTGELLDRTVADERFMYRVNCETPLNLAMEYGKLMVKRGKGGIIFVSSSVAYMPVPYWTHYSATKAYTLHVGEGMYHELKGKGVDVLTLCPGGMKTEFQEIAGISDIGAMEVQPVVKCALKAIGRKPSVVPGWMNAFAYKGIAKVLPSRLRLSLFGFMIKKLKHHA